MARSKYLIPTIGTIGALLVSSAIGLAIVGGDDRTSTASKVSVHQPDPASTTTEASGAIYDGGGGPTQGASQPSTSVVAGGARPGRGSTGGTATTVATATTVRPATTTSKPLTAKKPGPQAVTKPGLYTSDVTTTDDKGQQNDTSVDTTVKALADQAGVPHREIKVGDSGSFGGTSTVGYRPNGIYNERTVIDANGSTLDCTWDPAYPRYVTPLQVGTVWNYTSTCTGTFSGGQLDGTKAKIDNKGNWKVTGTDTKGVATATYGVWVITGTEDIDVTLLSGPAVGTTIKTHSDEIDRYSPDLGITMASESNTTFTAFGQTRTGKATSKLTKIATT